MYFSQTLPGEGRHLADSRHVPGAEVVGEVHKVNRVIV